MSFSEKSCLVFEQATKAYHITDHIDATVHNPYEVKSIEFYLYLKNWIDAVQWHMEDIIRNPAIEPTEGLVKVLPNATINTESPAWAIDRLSILILKIYHMQQEVDRSDATPEHKGKCEEKLRILLEQKKDLCVALDQLLADIGAGRKYMKVYKQMKMYNDPALNPVLYGKK